MSRYKYDPAKPRCNHKMSEAQFRTFVKNIIRDAHRKWSPKEDAKKLVRDGTVINPSTGRQNIAGRCLVCDGKFMEKDLIVDHREPFVPLDSTWLEMMNTMTVMEVANRMFCEAGGYGIMCKDCHYGVTQAENEYRRANK